MTELVNIALVDLIVDVRNARLRKEQSSEQSALLALANQQGQRIVSLAADIVEHGLDPTNLPAVIPTNDRQKRYFVIEGNRRVAALKALETPSLISPALNAASRKRLNNLAKKFSQNPISTINCVLFESEGEELDHWVRLRHTGQNGGVGLVEWGAEEKDRYTARHGHRSPEGQIIDFVEKHGGLSDKAKQSEKGIITSLKRLVNTPEVREMLGITISDGQVSKLYPTSEVAKSLTRVIEDLKTERIKVGDIYYAKNRIEYINSLADDDLPDFSTQFDSPSLLEDVENSATKISGTKSTRKRKRKGKSERTALVPSDCQLDISPPRINAIYNELSKLSTEQYPNACSVALRVFIELSVHHYLDQNNLMTDKEQRSTPLAKRLKEAADDLEKKGDISSQLKDAVYRVANNEFVLAASTVTFNMYVHNAYVYPKPTELRTAWDELQPFMEKLWS